MSANYLVNIISSSDGHENPTKRQTIVRNFSIHWVEIVFLFPLALPSLSLTHSLFICIIFKTLRWRTVPRSTYLALVRWVAPCAPHALEKHEAARKTSPAQHSRRFLLVSLHVSFSLYFSIASAFVLVLLLLLLPVASLQGHINYDNHKNYLPHAVSYNSSGCLPPTSRIAALHNKQTQRQSQSWRQTKKKNTKKKDARLINMWEFSIKYNTIVWSWTSNILRASLRASVQI